MLTLAAWISIVIAGLSTVLVIGGIIHTDSDRVQLAVAAILAAAGWFTGFLFLALAGILRWVQLIEWRLGLKR